VKRLLERLRLQGDLFPRLLAWAVPHCPFYLEPILIAGYTLVFFAMAATPRRAVQANLAVIDPSAPRLRLAFRSFRVFWNFAWTCVDGERARSGDTAFRWDIIGRERFDSAAEPGRGLIVLTAHMGNYDVAAAAFAKKFGRKVHAVRAPEPTAALQEFRRAELTESAGDSLEIAYNAPGGLLGVELVRALHAGEAVAVQGDRVMFDVSPIACRFGGRQIRIPKGPFVLAMLGGVPLIPIFILRAGISRYRIVCMDAFECRRARGDREGPIAEAAARWCSDLESIVTENWHQWFVFEPAFEPEPKP